MRNEEGGNRDRLTCLTDNGHKFHPIVVCSEEWEEEFLKRNNLKVSDLYYPPYNFKRSGCVGCPFNVNLEQELITMKKLLPSEYKRAFLLWKPIYDEYNRIGYRLNYNHLNNIQLSIFDME
jgi:3'-phosphoadenosine 5'-phosphosulfate sulfotransferase (PAPS reductase)/FAD synthetase